MGGVTGHQPARRPGALVISLDFELHWGVRDVRTFEEYRDNLLGVRQAVPGMLRLFEDRGVHATWATVGFLFFRRKADLLAGLPKELPTYTDGRFDPYADLATVGEDEASDPFHFGADLLEQIRRVPGQEVASHTFSHYYCLEAGQTVGQFRSDLRAAVAAAKRAGVPMRTLVFPRNQLAPAYVRAARDEGFDVVRGPSGSWLDAPRASGAESPWRRVLRLVDSYIPLSGPNVVGWGDCDGKDGTCNVRSSRFLRPHWPALAWLEWARARRIRRGMTAAARSGGVYHLWWHPHNFGAHTQANLAFLQGILDHFCFLRERYGMASLSMAEAADAARAGPRR